MKEDSEKTIQSPEQLADHLRVTYVPTYLLAAASAMLLMARSKSLNTFTDNLNEREQN